MSHQANTTVGTASIAIRTASTVTLQTLSDYSQRGRLNWAKWIVGIAFAGLSLSLLASGKAEAISFAFEKIVDTNTPVPGGTGTFTFLDPSFEIAPSLDDGDIAFLGFSVENFEEGFRQGIYTNVGGELNVVADENTLFPGSIGTPREFDSPSLDNGSVGFEVSDTDLQYGIYTNIGGELNVVADPNTPIPGGTGTFALLGSASLDNGNVAFEGFGGAVGGSFEQEGIYTNIGGELSVVANRNTPIPGGTGTLELGYGLSLNNGSVAFGGRSVDKAGAPSQSGIYTNIGGKLNVVADRSTPIPGGAGNFEFLDSPSLDNRNVAFEGFGGGQSGIYTNTGGTLDVIADPNTLIPGGIGNFRNAINPSLDNGNVAFLGFGQDLDEDGFLDPIGIYMNIGSELIKVIAKGDRLDSKEVSDFTFGQEGLSGNQIAFTAEFDDSSQGIYIATVPEPSSVLGTLAFGAFSTGWMLKRKLKKQKLVS